nr:hypothetical protein [Tanacetum cinerariifolium]
MSFQRWLLNKTVQNPVSTSRQISSELELTYAPSIITPQRPSERNLDILFEPLHNEYLGGRSSEAPRTIPAAPVLQNLQAPTASMSIQEFAPTPTNSSNTLISSHNVDKQSPPHAQQQMNHTSLPTASAADDVPNAVFEGDLFVNPFATPSTKSVVSSTQYVDPSYMHTFYQPYPHDYQWTKDHSLEQSNYVNEILKKYRLNTCDIIGTPMDIKDKLDLDQIGTLVDATKYRSMIGALMYLKSSRPDIVHTTCDSGCELTRFLDADYAGCKDTFKSTSESEYVSLSACCAQVLWMRTQLTDYGYYFNKIPIYCHSKSAIAISCNPVQHSRMKYIAVRYHFIKEHVEKGTSELYFVKTDYQLADIFTKALLVDIFNYLVCRLGMRNLCPQELDCLTRQISSDLELTYAPSTITPQRPSERDLDILFEPLHNEYLGGRPSEAPRTIPAAPVLQNLQAPTASMSIQEFAPTPTNSSNTLISSHKVDEQSPPHAQQQRNHTSLPTAYAADDVPNAVFEGDLFVNPFATPSTKSVVSSTQYVNKSPSGIFINQFNYVNEILKKYGLNTCDIIGTPMDIKDKLDLDQIGTLVDATKYRSMIGALMYLKSSRPDIVHTTCDSGCELTRFSDADYAGCKDTFKSTSESEYVSLSACCAQVLWMRTQLTDYGYYFNKIPIYCDSKSAIAISCNPVQHSRMKYIAVRYHFIKEHVEKGTSELTSERYFCDIHSDDGNPSRANIKQALGRRSGLRTTGAAAKPCQGDSLEFYLITGSIYTDQRGTVAEDQPILISELDMSCPLHLHPNDSAAFTIVSIKLKFLMGLDDCYMQIRSNILSRDVLSNVRNGYAIIFSEESHRVLSSSSSGFGDLLMGLLLCVRIIGLMVILLTDVSKLLDILMTLKRKL